MAASSAQGFQTEPPQVPSGLGGKKVAVRDTGVGDAVWNQLQQDRLIEERKAKEVLRLRVEEVRLQAWLKNYADAKRQHELAEVERKRQELEGKKKCEEVVKKKLTQMGRCPAHTQGGFSRVQGRAEDQHEIPKDTSGHDVPLAITGNDDAAQEPSATVPNSSSVKQHVRTAVVPGETLVPLQPAIEPDCWIASPGPDGHYKSGCGFFLRTSYTCDATPEQFKKAVAEHDPRAQGTLCEEVMEDAAEDGPRRHTFHGLHHDGDWRG
ncbi:hypothetical protein LTR62_001681 [Meristemomyces frigidus]|uniref:Uncharacterized protein n=1 Tax=Meristemomyces frigidus TaxID=1508187 RepID=A0AAN7YBG6_9PEZI|nr:hypothetical protein LTR62_001681 [Meristemomyces frigidus]